MLDITLTRMQKLDIRTHDVKLLKEVAKKDPQYALFILQDTTEKVNDGYDISYFTNAVVSASWIIKGVADTLRIDSGLDATTVAKHGMASSTYTDMSEVNYDCNALKKFLNWLNNHQAKASYDYLVRGHGKGFQEVKPDDADQAIDDLSKYLLIPLALKDNRVVFKKGSLKHVKTPSI